MTRSSYLWGFSFRETYQRLGEIKSLLPKLMNILALTATASKSTRLQVIKMLGLHPPKIVYLPPVRFGCSMFGPTNEENK